jgi:hypothetical protein
MSVYLQEFVGNSRKATVGSVREPFLMRTFFSVFSETTSEVEPLNPCKMRL